MEVLKATASQWQSVSPKMSFSPDALNEFSISFDMSGRAEDEIEVLNLPERIAEEKGCQVIVCIDEFQK